MTNIKVRWKDGDRGPKGQIIEDEKGRRKIVFVASEHRGRWPRHDEVTEARVTYEKEPENPNKGFLKVIPIFMADPKALSGSEANAALLKMARDAGATFASYGHTIEVDLPGWRGVMKGNLMRRSCMDAPLSMLWRYQDDDIGRMIIVSDPESSVGGVAITAGIWIDRRGVPQMANWTLAVKDLGEPDTVKACLNTAEAIWRDRSGHSLHVGDIPLEMIIEASGFTVKDVREMHDGDVIGTISMLGGKLLMQDELLGEAEEIDYRSDQLKPAHFTKWVPLPLAVQEQVVTILRQTLHSPAWHQQNYLARCVSEQASWSRAMWETLRNLQGCVQDQFCPLRVIERALADVRSARTEIDVTKARPVHAFSNETADTRIYGGVTIEDSAAVAALTAENNAAIARIDAMIKECEHAMTLIPGKREHHDFRTAVWMASTAMLEKIVALGDKVVNIWIKGELEDLVQDAENEFLDLEQLLEEFYRGRGAFKNITEQIKAEEAAS